MHRYQHLILFIFILCGLSCDPEPHEPSASRKKTITWQFPLPRTHTGILMGNGRQGAMIWGNGPQLHITIGRAGFWDHRGGNDFLAKTTYAEVKSLLEAGDLEGLRDAFDIGKTPPEGIPARPYQIGGGRLELMLPEGWRLEQGDLNIERGALKLTCSDEHENKKALELYQHTYNDLLSVRVPPGWREKIALQWVPTWEHVGKQLSAYGIEPPVTFASDVNQSAGFVQYLPEDDPLAIGHAWNENMLMIATFLGEDAGDALRAKLSEGPASTQDSNEEDWWSRYWHDVPKIEVPDPVIQEIIDYGLYKQAISTPPHGLACSLQGPFNEEYQIPPWSNDYHFNINIEMIYLPALATNRAQHFEPVWQLIEGWIPQLQKNGESFFGREGALMLPHAVDDRCQVVGSFWTGTIDHACTAWMAQLAWQHYRFTRDTLRFQKTGWPLLVGAFEGFWAMKENDINAAGKEVFSLPVSVSPEFKGAAMDAWGKNASFQLAAFRMIAEIMPKAAKVLGKQTDGRWKEVLLKTPHYSIIHAPKSKIHGSSERARIALWEGMDLIESHRHHSHMAGIYPFQSFDPLQEEHREVANQTYYHWKLTGKGAWSGWCVPWASILNSRVNQSEAAVSLLHYWNENFVNEGRGTLHDAAFDGISIIYSGNWDEMEGIEQNREKMQLDAGFGALSAALELLVQNRRGVIHIFPDLHRDWKNVSFEGIAVEGGFLVSATVSEGQIQSIEVYSKFGGPLRINHGLGNFIWKDQQVHDPIFTYDFKPGEKISLKRKES